MTATAAQRVAIRNLAHQSLTRDRCLGLLAAGLVIVASLYNAVLALISAHVKTLGSIAPAASEISILIAALAVTFLRRRIEKDDLSALSLLFLFAILAVFTSLLSETIFPDTLRNVLIIATFFMLGRRCKRQEILLVFTALSMTTLACLILEVVSSTTYAELFQPGNYYAATRGMEVSEYNDTGLFNNALGFGSRFSFGIFSGAQTSSVFLEQVSLANFATVLCIFLISTWRHVGWLRKIIMPALILLILLSNNTRTSSILAISCLFGYFIYPLLSRWLILLVAPCLVAVAFVIAHPTEGIQTDDLVGRLGITVSALRTLDVPTMLGAHALRSRHLLDTGYGYVIVSGTIFGMIGLWLFFSLAQRVTDASSRRCAWGAALYLFVNMMIGGTAIFSMKVAAPLWMLVGYMGATAPRFGGQLDSRPDDERRGGG